MMTTMNTSASNVTFGWDDLERIRKQIDALPKIPYGIVVDPAQKSYIATKCFESEEWRKNLHPLFGATIRLAVDHRNAVQTPKICWTQEEFQECCKLINPCS